MKKNFIIPALMVTISGLLLLSCGSETDKNTAMKSPEEKTVNSTETSNQMNNTENQSKKGFATNIEKETEANNDYRKVLYTAKYSQLVLMSLKPKEEIGTETHEKNDQFFRFESGQGKCIIDGHEYEVRAGDAVIVPSGAKHNVINTSGTEPLKLYTIYSPPNHKDGVVRKTREEADAYKEKFDGKTTE